MTNQVVVLEIEDGSAPATTRDAPTNTTSAANGLTNTPRPARPSANSRLPDTPRRLCDLPEYANRYQPIFSTLEDVVYRDSHKFCLKPPYWERWSDADYLEFAHQLQLVDLRPMARALNKPVEEVLHMYDGVVVGLLKDASKASKRGVQTMKSWFKLYRESGTPTRIWTDTKIQGELEDITCQTIHLILEDGNKGKITLDQLNKADYAWIHENILLQNRKILSGMADGEESKYDTDDGLPPYLPTQSLKRKLSPEIATPQPQKKARLEVEPATAPAKLVATPSAPTTAQAMARQPQPESTPSKPPVTAQTPQTQIKTSEATPQVSASPAPTNTPAGRQAAVPDSPATFRAATPHLSSLDARQATVTPSQGRSAVHQAATVTTPKPSLLVKIPIASPEDSMIYRPWTSVGVIAGLKATSPAAIVVEEQNGKTEIVLSRCALNEKDKKWLNEAYKSEMVDKESWYILLAKDSSATSSNAFRLWTASKRLARAEQILHHSVRLLLLSDRTTMEVSVDELSEADHAYLQEHFTADEIERLDSAAAEQEATGSDADAENEVEEPGEVIEVLHPTTVGISRDTVTSSEATQQSVVKSRGTAALSSEEPYEAITGAPIRSWTDDSFMANLVGIANRVVYLRVEGEAGVRKLPMADWTVEDKEWLRDYLVDEQRRILSGKLRK
ncbi:hypothetical protein Slin15195_G060840 [Septoria linicola]|uniref:Uncharacterized protein n=1 Tax=Septoria linicola TaxID=215465 RepID=A0A9Q9AUI4_9PEZI|nr:hypothetical protein Slin15195_G060840 [Septoria linicola]